MADFKTLPVPTKTFKPGQRVQQNSGPRRYGTVVSVTDARYPAVQVRWDDSPDRPTVHRPHSLRRTTR